MPKERVLETFLVRFTEKDHREVTLVNIRTGERLEFETWIAAWSFLEQLYHQSSPSSDKTDNPFYIPRQTN